MAINKQVSVNMKGAILLLSILKTSFALSMLHLSQLYSSLGAAPQQAQVNPNFLMTPAQLLQNHIAQLGSFQLLPNYLLFANQLMQPRLPQTQILPTYPIFGNLLAAPSGLPSTQMLPVMFAQVGQGLQSASDSEESIMSGVIMMPVGPGLQGNMIPVLHPGITIDSGILVNPVGQQGINSTIPDNNALPPPTTLPDLSIHGIVPGAGIIKPSTEGSFTTFAPPVGLQRTPVYLEPTAPVVPRGDMTDHPEATENWIVCNSYIPENPPINNVFLVDEQTDVILPNYVLIENSQDNQNHI